MKRQPTAKEFWAFIEKAAKEVETWPAWKRILFPEKHLPQTAVGVKKMPKRNKDDRLKVEIKKDKLVMSIGIDTLAFSFNESDYAKPYNRKKDDWVPKLKVIDPKQFAEDVGRALLEEEENGDNLLNKLLDKACEEACEQGTEGVEEVKSK